MTWVIIATAVSGFVAAIIAWITGKAKGVAQRSNEIQIKDDEVRRALVQSDAVTDAKTDAKVIAIEKATQAQLDRRPTRAEVDAELDKDGS